MENEKHGKIVRGFSMVDPEMVSKLHKDIRDDIEARGREDEQAGGGGCNFREIAHFNFTLPDFPHYEKDFVEFMMKDLVENSTLKALNESGHLNWWTKGSSLQPLYPLLTSGDGNCLLHAASLGIWGVHDRLLNLRQAVHHVLSSSLAEKTLKGRWLWYEWVKYLNEGLVLGEAEWEEEWKGVINMADAKPRSPRQVLSTVPETSAVENEGSSVNQEEVKRKTSNSWQPRYESLEEIHICTLAHVLRRPIIVVSDNWVYDFQGNAMSPIPFAGVYLPVECDPSECCRVPLVLAYSSSHFSPVVSMEQGTGTEDSADPENSSNGKNANTSPEIKSACNSSQSVDVPTTASSTSTSSSIQSAMSSFYQFTKATILNAAKSLNSSVTPGPLESENQNDSIHAAIPLVDKDFKTLPLPFGVDPGPDWNWLEQENSKDIVDAKSLTEEQRMSLLKKYLDVVNIDFKVEPSLDQNNEMNGSRTPDSPPKHHPIPVAVLPCDNQPSFYKVVIAGYIEKAKERFNFEKETRIEEVEETTSLKCANDGCDLYGTVAKNYLCTKCFQLQSQSIGKYIQPPPYEPPSYAEAVGDKQVFIPPSLAGKSNAENTKTLKELSVECRAPGCSFYGTSDKMGYCSKCYGQNKK